MRVFDSVGVESYWTIVYAGNTRTHSEENRGEGVEEQRGCEGGGGREGRRGRERGGILGGVILESKEKKRLKKKKRKEA